VKSTLLKAKGSPRAPETLAAALVEAIKKTYNDTNSHVKRGDEVADSVEQRSGIKQVCSVKSVSGRLIFL
jgi:hypothetical protein